MTPKSVARTVRRYLAAAAVRVHVELSDGTLCPSRADLDAAFGSGNPVCETVMRWFKTEDL